MGLGFAVTLGATTLLLQNAIGESGLIFLIPLIIDMVVVALGTDDTILRMARLREEATNGRSPREATRCRRRWGSRCRSGSWWPRS